MIRILKKPGFYGILDSAYVPRTLWIDKCQALIEGGATLVQLRAKQQTHCERLALLEAILPLFQQPNAPQLIVNDDLELALKYPNLGLHVGQDDTPVAAARAALGSDRILGLSTHSLQQAAGAIQAANDLSYFAVGPVFATQTKPDYTPVGLELVAAVAQLQPPIPWYCIGGIDEDNLRQVTARGAHNVVSVSAVLNAEDTAAAVARIVQALKGLAQ